VRPRQQENVALEVENGVESGVPSCWGGRSRAQRTAGSAHSIRLPDEGACGGGMLASDGYTSTRTCERVGAVQPGGHASHARSEVGFEGRPQTGHKPDGRRWAPTQTRRSARCGGVKDLIPATGSRGVRSLGRFRSQACVALGPAAAPLVAPPVCEVRRASAADNCHPDPSADVDEGTVPSEPEVRVAILLGYFPTSLDSC
jgi:hypothetical protein